MRNLLPKSLNYVRHALAFALLAMTGTALFAQSQETATPVNLNNPFVEAMPNLAPTTGANPSTEALWDIQGSFNATASTNGDLGMAACLFFNNEFWVSRWASDTLYRFSPTGTLISEFVIPGLTGTRALTTDGTLIYAGTATATIYKINPTTQTLVPPNISTSVTTGVRHITYDPTLNSNAGGFWVGNFNTDITPVSLTGATLPGTILAATHGLGGMYGSAYDGTSSGGPYLWIFHQGGSQNCEITQLQLPAGTQTLVTHDVMSDAGTLAGSLTSGLAGGLSITSSYNVSNRSLVGTIQGTPNNVVFAYELSDAVIPSVDLDVSGLRPTAGYTQIPVNQVFAETFDLTLSNLGADPADTAYVDIRVRFNGGATVFTDTQTNFNLASAGTVVVSSAPFTPANGVGSYDVTAIARLGTNQTDSITSNDTVFFSFQVTDSTFARDNGNPSGTPYSVSNDWAYAISTFTLTNPDTVSSIWISLETPIDLDTTYAVVTNTVGGTPNAPLALGQVEIISGSQNDYVLLIPGGLPLGAGTYGFGCYEGANTGINLRQSTSIFTPGTNFFLTGAGGWSPSNIQSARFIRPNFGTPVAVGVDQMRDYSVQVFPNPSNGNFTVMFREELNTELNLSVVDMVGKEVARKVVNPSSQRATTFDLSDQAAGVYFVRVEGMEGTVVKKIMVTR
jgi:hypothetical protein